MPNDQSHTPIILFEEFIHFLRQNGFSVGVDTHIKVNRLVEGLPESYPASQMKTLLAPLFASNPQEQEAFYQLFESYFDRYLASNIPIKQPTAAPVDSKADNPSLGILTVLSKRRYYMFFQVLLLIVLGYFGIKSIDCYVKTRQLGSTLDCMLGRNFTIVSQDSLLPSPGNPEIDTLPQVIDSPPAITQNDSLLQQISRIAPLDNGKPIPENIDNMKAPFYRQYGLVAKVLIIVLIITTFIFYEFYWYNRKKLTLIRESAKAPPYYWTLGVPDQEVVLYNEQEFYEASRKLRERQPTESKELDLEKTIEKTVEAGGYPQFSYQAKTRPPEYLVLIQKLGPSDHQAMLFDQMILELEQQDIYVNRYFFDQDPRLCWKKQYQDEMYLEDLYRRYPDDRLIIIGNPDVLFDPLTDELSSWTAMLHKWKQIAWMTPQNPLLWSHREVELSRHLTLLPTTLEALGVILDLFNQHKRPPLRYWLEQNKYPIPPDPYSENLVAELRTYFDTVYQHKQPVTNVHPGSSEFIWLCSCALYPELSWDLTLALGVALGKERGISLATPENLYKLISLPWFKTGVIPEDIRESLIAQMPPQALKEARQTVIRILKENPPPSGSYAAAEHQLTLAVQEAQLHPGFTNSLKAVQEAQTYSINHEIRDYVVVRYLRTVPSSVVNFILPDSLNPYFFRQGIPALGIRTWVRATLMVAVVGMIMFSVNPSTLDHVQTFRGEQYYVQNKESRMRLYTYIGNTYLDSALHWQAEQNFRQAIRLRDEIQRSDYLTPDFNLTWMKWERGLEEEATGEFARISDQAADLLEDTLISPAIAMNLRTVKSKANYSQGVIAYRSQQPEKAEEEFLDALEADSLNLQAVYGRALAFLQKGIRAQGAAQASYFNLSQSEIAQIRDHDPAFFSRNLEITAILDSIAQKTTNFETRDRIRQLLAATRDDSSAEKGNVPLVLEDSGKEESQPQIPGVFEFVDYFSGGRARVKFQGKYGFIDSLMTVRVSPSYDDAKPFSEGLAAVKKGKKWGYINPHDETVIGFEYAQAQPFLRGWASVKKDGKWGVINTRGQVRINFLYDLPVTFENPAQVPPGNEPLAAVYRNGKYEYIRQDGSPAFGNIKFQLAYNFEANNLAKVKRWDKKYLLNRQGACVANCPEERWYSQQVSMLAERDEVYFALYAPNGQFLLTASANGTAKIWGASGRNLVATLEHKDRVRSAAIDSRSDLIATVSDDQTAKVWRKENGAVSLWRMYDDARAALWSVAMSPNGRFIATGSSDGLIRVYDLVNNQRTALLRGHGPSNINALQFSPDGRLLASGSDDGSLRIWNWNTSTQLDVQQNAGEVLSISFSPRGNLLAIGTKRSRALIYEIKNGALNVQYSLDQFENWVSLVDFSSDGKYLLTASFDKKARIWSLDSRQVVLEILHRGMVRAAAFSPDQQAIITASSGEKGKNSVNIFNLDRY